MKKRIQALFLVLALILVGVWYPSGAVQAEEVGEDIDYAFLNTEDALVGHMQAQTWGVYLMSGDSSIVKLGTGKAGAGGSTTAARKCSISVLVVVERLNNGSLGRWTSWKASKSSDVLVTTARELTVPTGYYYRVRCTHAAGGDVSSSWTGGLKI